MPVGVVSTGMRQPLVRHERVLDRVTAVEEIAPSVEELASFPEALVLIAVGLALAGGAWWGIRRLGRSPGRRFKRALAKEDHVTVLMHPNPDPDAMACALGVSEIAESVDTDATLQFPGQIRHQENRAFRTVLDLSIDRIETVDDLASRTVVLVDHNAPRGFEGAERIRPYAIIDHHPGSGEGLAFTDVRPEYGACASVITEYFREIDAPRIGPSESAPESADGPVLGPVVATGLLYGIQSDTKHLTKGCTEAEFDACAYLFPAVDEDRLDRIANPQVTAEVLEVKARAIENRRVNGSFAISDVGELGDADAIPQAADELMQLEGVTAVVVYGRHDGTIHLSGRSRDDRVHMGRALEAAVDVIPMATAGGHARMGGGQVPVEYMNGLGPSDGISDAEFETRLFASLSGDV